MKNSYVYNIFIILLYKRNPPIKYPYKKESL